MKSSFTLIAIALTLSLLGGSGCAPERTGLFRQSRTSILIGLSTTSEPGTLRTPKQVESDVTIVSATTQPPPPQIEVVGEAPKEGYLWIPGRWECRGDWTWASGQWKPKPDTATGWNPGRWVRRDQGWLWIRGYWRWASSPDLAGH